jgi:hypothetical protein
MFNTANFCSKCVIYSFFKYVIFSQFLIQFIAHCWTMVYSSSYYFAFDYHCAIISSKTCLFFYRLDSLLCHFSVMHHLQNGLVIAISICSCLTFTQNIVYTCWRRYTEAHFWQAKYRTFRFQLFANTNYFIFFFCPNKNKCGNLSHSFFLCFFPLFFHSNQPIMSRIQQNPIS